MNGLFKLRLEFENEKILDTKVKNIHDLSSIFEEVKKKFR